MMKRFIASSLVITSTIAPIITYAQETPSTMITNADYVNVRKGATTSYEVVTQLKKGQTVKILDQFTNVKGEVWFRVDLGEIQGWVISQYLDPIEEEEQPVSFSKKVMYVTSDKVILRKGATITYPVVETLNQNQQVTAIDRFVNSIGEAWLRIETSSNLGWVQEKYLQETQVSSEVPFSEKNMYVNSADTKVHKGATESYPVVLTLKLNTQVKVVDTFTNSANVEWSRVLIGGTYGWVKSSLLSESIKQQYTATTMYVSKNNFPLRKGASIHYESIATLKLNQTVKVIGEFINSGETWYRLQITSKVLGWVPAASLSKQPVQNIKIQVNVNNAIVRSGASPAYKIVANMPKGKTFTAISTFTNSQGEVWYRIEYSVGRYGWISSSVVTASPVAASVVKYVGTKNANVYRGASFGYQVKDHLEYGEKITVLSEFINAYDQKWLSVKTADGLTGWTPSWELFTSLTSVPLVYNVSSPKLYKGASTSYSEAGKITSGTPLIKLWSFNEWYNVETLNGVRGWILISDVSTTSPKGLFNPVITKENTTTHHVKWKKPNAVSSIKYSLPASNQILISGDIASIDLPANVPGITSTKTINNSNGTKSLQINLDSSYTFTLRNYENSIDLKVMKKGLSGKKIIVDAGHGDYDPGAIGPSGVREKDVNLAVAKYLKAELENYGATVLLTRSTDVFLELSERTDIANRSDYDAFVSIHSNSFSSTSRGTQTFYDTSVNFNGAQSKLMAQDVQTALTNHVGTYNRGITDNDFFVTRENELPSILVELAYLSNPTEEQLLKSDSFRRKASAGIRIGLQNFFN
jgi:N-acetylmuramoyl-L-alanine amidase